MPENRDHHFLFPGTIFASKLPFAVTTILGSCVSVCLWDKLLKFGGINHYLLPLWNGRGLRSPKYGNIAIEKLIKNMLQLGCQNGNLHAKIFGGASVLNSTNSAMRIGEQNIIIVNELLVEYKIPVISSSLGGVEGRKLVFYTDSGTVLMKKIAKSI